MNFARDLLSSAAARGTSPRACVALFALFAGTLTAWTAFVIGRYGSPLRWPLVHRAALVFLSLGGSFAWWWINGAVEGRPIVGLTNDHGLTIGDLFVLPALVFATLLVVVETGPRLRRVLTA